VPQALALAIKAAAELKHCPAKTDCGCRAQIAGGNSCRQNRHLPINAYYKANLAYILKPPLWPAD
jgi:hypothetical protein